MLKELTALPLERKIAITQARIIEWYNHFNGQVYVSTSGGKDSTVLYDIVHKLFPDVPAVFSDTGLEYPEIRQFVKANVGDGLTVLRPKKMFPEIIKEYGYPIVSKEVSECIYYARRIPENIENITKKSTVLPPPYGYKEAEWKQRELLGCRPDVDRKEFWNDKNTKTIDHSPPRTLSTEIKHRRVWQNHNLQTI